MTKLDELKRHVFFEFLNLTGRAYIIVKYSKNVILGRRGFTDEERNNGIILVFNSNMNFTWDDDGIKTTLIFGNSPQKCFIPVEDIMLISSPELDAQFSAHLITDTMQIPEKKVKDKALHTGKRPEAEKEQKKVIKVDFTKKRKKDG